MTTTNGQTMKKLAAALLALSALGMLRGGAAGQNERGQNAVAKNERPPILRIETGMHTARIRRIGVDAAGRYLVTGSYDKTVRVWELATGRLLRVLRPPLGKGDEWKIYAVAISSDGRLIAVGGWMAAGSESIYLFDRESGRIVRRLGGLPSTVFDLAFSPDGTRLAVALSEGGIRVFSMADGAEIGRDTDYGASSRGLDFDRTGRLVTSCDDDYLRLYDRSLKLIKKVHAPGGKEPLGVRFAPDSSKVAVGYSDKKRVDVLDGATLEKLYQPNTKGGSNGNLAIVAWSADGSALYAGGMWDDGTGVHPIRRWADAGRGQYQDMAAADNTILTLATLPDGGVVFGAFDPVWGVFSAVGIEHMRVAGETADYRDNEDLRPFVNALRGLAFADSNGRAQAGVAIYKRLE